MESSFLELRCKEVINVTNGKKLGHIVDIVFDLCSAKVKGLVVPASSGFNLFKQPEQLFIPYDQICKIGEDTILVELYTDDKQKPYILNAPKNK